MAYGENVAQRKSNGNQSASSAAISCGVRLAKSASISKQLNVASHGGISWHQHRKQRSVAIGRKHRRLRWLSAKSVSANSVMASAILAGISEMAASACEITKHL